MPQVTDGKIHENDEPEYEGPPTRSDAYDGIYFGLQQ